MVQCSCGSYFHSYIFLSLSDSNENKQKQFCNKNSDSIILITDQPQQKLNNRNFFSCKDFVAENFQMYSNILCNCTKMFDMRVSNQKFVTWKFLVCGTACAHKANTEYCCLEIFHS